MASNGGGGVSWLWLGDDKTTWNEYNSRISEKIEEAHKAGKTKVRVDTQRFVDLQDMVQRRYDLSGKDRPVKRVVSSSAATSGNLFEGLIFFLLGSFSTPKEKLSASIDSEGGLIAWGFHKRVTHVICNPAESSSVMKHLAHIAKEAKKHDIPVLSEDFISASISKRKLLDVDDFTVSIQKDKNGEGNGSKATKRKLSSDEPSQDQPAKKSKVSDEEVAEYLSDKFEKNDTVKGSVFQGHPFELAITTRKEDKLEGIIEWPTLDNTITKWRGKIEGSSISIEEFETMEGDGVEVPNNYVGKFSSGKIVGMATDPHGETSRFEITLPS